MKLPSLRSIACAVVGIALTFTIAIAHAQLTADRYPSRPLRMVIPWPPGGPTDVVARVIAQRLGDRLGQPVVVDNRPGAGGNTAAAAFARESADGYTLLYNTGSITTAPWTWAKAGYDPVKDFTHVLLTAEQPLVLVVHPSLAAKTPSEFIALLKANPGKYNYGSSGSGAAEHLTSALFLHTYNLEATHIPYKGTAPALIDLLSGRTQFMMTTLNTALQYIRDGRLTALGVTSRKRSSVVAELATLSEGLPTNFEATAWQGILLPANAPQPIVRKLNEALNGVLQEEGVRQNLAKQGVNILGGTPEHYAAFVKSEYERWEAVVKRTGARAD